MTREEAIQICKEVRHRLWILDEQKPILDKGAVGEALLIAIEALKAQDRPIICPRCGREFAESEGREKAITKGEYLKLKGIRCMSHVDLEEEADVDFRRMIDALVEREGIEPPEDFCSYGERKE